MESSSSTSRPYASMNKDREVVLFLSAEAAICLLNFNLSVGAKNHCTDSPRPRWHHTRSQQLLDAHLHVVLLEGPVLLDERESHLALFLSRFSFRSQFFSGSQVDSKRCHTVCHRHSFILAVLTQLVLQVASRSNHLTLSFLSILSDRKPFFSTLLFQLPHHLLCHVCYFRRFSPSRVL